MKTLLTALALSLTCGAIAAAQTPAAAPAVADENQPMRLIGATSAAMSYITPVTDGAGGVKVLNQWMFYKAPRAAGTQQYNTVSTRMEVNCAARTQRTTNLIAYWADPTGADPSSKQIATEASNGPMAAATAGSVNAAIVDAACGGALNDDKNPELPTIAAARGYASAIFNPAPAAPAAP